MRKSAPERRGFEEWIFFFLPQVSSNFEVDK